MTPDLARADRLQEVRDAAARWKKAGIVDEATRSVIAALYPDDRRRLGLGLRILAGVAAFFGGMAIVGAIIGILRPGARPLGALLLVLGAGFALTTEYQIGPLRRRSAGAELATGWLAVLLVPLGVTLLVGDVEPWLYLTIATLTAALGAYRWGFASLAGAACVFGLPALARLPIGRTWWIAACLAAVAVTRRPLERLSPAHRRCARVVFAAALVGLYLAFHYDSVKVGLIETIGGRAHTWGAQVRVVAAAVTALLPIAVVAFGVRRRDRIAISVGALMIGASLATWRWHGRLLPLWLFLIVAGAACFVTAILVRRFLDRAPGREWRGITADPLLDDARGAAALRVAAVATTLGAAPGPPSDRPFQSGGGASGGGGAQGQF